MGSTHWIFGGLCGAAYATHHGGDFTSILMTTVIATATSHGWLSPDVDTSKVWKRVRRFMPWPIDLLMNHRHITHFALWPFLAWRQIPNMDPQWQWAAVAALIGWCSHLLGDLIFGKLPLLPTGRFKIGLGLDTDGFIESGKVPLFGKDRRVIPFGPLRLATGLALAFLLYAPLAQDNGWPMPANVPGIAADTSRAAAHHEPMADVAAPETPGDNVPAAVLAILDAHLADSRTTDPSWVAVRYELLTIRHEVEHLT